MRYAKLTAYALVVLLGVTGCEDMTREERMIAGAAAGAMAGLITAEVLEADSDWRIVAVLGGAAIGTLVARNRSTGRCAYARGDGYYYTRPCP